MRWLLWIAWLACFSSCCTYRSFERERETTTRDTIVSRDSVYLRIVVPGDTVYMEREKIVPDTVYVQRFIAGQLTLPPWEAETPYAYARAGITDNVPWLRLEQRGVSVDTTVYVNHIRILEERLRESEKQIVKEEPFYNDTWFWLTIVLGLYIVIFLKLKV